MSSEPIVNPNPIEVHTPKKMNPAVIMAIMAMALVIIVVLGIKLTKDSLVQIQAGARPDDFTIRTYAQATPTFTLSDFRGHVVVINFWASWCDTCKDEVLDLNAIWDEYRPKGVMLIGITHVDTTDKAIQFIHNYNIQYLTGPDNGTNIYDAFRVGGVPETYVIDKQGNVAKTFIGVITADQLRPVLDSLLNS
jgi:cytochrome c biogenesis protein CcmG/thiol:disulfide interchange protein DsbE